MKNRKKTLSEYIPILIFLTIFFVFYIQIYEKMKFENISMKYFSIIMIILTIILSPIIFWGNKIIDIYKNGFHNLRNCDDKLFENIDVYKKRRWKIDNVDYLRQIKIINLYYSKNGKVDVLVKEKELERLFQRRDFLLKQATWSENFITYFNSLVISGLASFIFAAYSDTNLIKNIASIIVILFIFFEIIFINYAERGENGSYHKQILEYEMKLLDEKIEHLEKNSIITPDDEKLLLTKQIVLNELIKKRKKAKRKGTKETLEKDIKIVENLELCMGDYSDFFLQNIYLGEKEIYLVYNKEKGKTKKCTGEKYLATQDYAILYNILKKYDWISYE